MTPSEQAACDCDDSDTAEEYRPRHHDMMKRLVELHERERQLLAYEIHDGLVQLVAGAQMSFQAFVQLRGDDPMEAESTLQNGIAMLTQGVREARRLISGLRPPMLERTTLIEALHEVVFESPQENAPEVEFFHRVDFERLGYEFEIGAFRIAQEALNNARRHSQSDIVRLEVTQDGDRLRIVVKDWGIGFDPATIPENHFGLESICQRAKILGGRADIETAPGQGTCVCVDLPIPDDEPDAF